MIYKTVPLYSVVARIIRVTKSSDSSYEEDIEQWLQEGVKKYKVRGCTNDFWQDLEVCDHVAKMPCGIVSLESVEYCGHRLREGIGSATGANALPNRHNSRKNSANDVPSEFRTNPSDPYYKGDYFAEQRGLDLEKSSSGSVTNDFYKVQLNALHFSFPKGTVRVYYRGLPVDSNNYLLIPDNEDYKEALMWYVFKWLAFSGFRFPDSRITTEYCEIKAEKFAVRARQSIKALSADRKEAIIQATVRLVKPAHFYEDFGINSEQVQSVDTHLNNIV